MADESSSVTPKMRRVGAPAPTATLSVVNVQDAVSAGASPSANAQMDTESPFTTIFSQNHESYQIAGCGVPADTFVPK